MKRAMVLALMISLILVSGIAGCSKCIAEGEKGNVFNEEKCCNGLEQIAYCDSINVTLFAIEDGSFNCAKDCGDGACTNGENYCNCPEDCK